MKALELRLDPKAVKPLVDHIKRICEDLEGDLATSAVPPEEDDLMAGIWKGELLQGQDADLSAIKKLFDDEFFESGRARITEVDADFILRGCSAIRLRLRELTLAAISDGDLEGGEIDFEAMSQDERVGYGAYSLMASLQELIVSQFYG